MQYRAIPCNSMQYHAIPCNAMQYHAMPCNTMQYHAIQLNTMQYHAILCNTMQYYVIQCKTTQYHASSITADGAYHCPVGSIWLFFSSTTLNHMPFIPKVTFQTVWIDESFFLTEAQRRSRFTHPLQAFSSEFSTMVWFAAWMIGGIGTIEESNLSKPSSCTNVTCVVRSGYVVCDREM